LEISGPAEGRQNRHRRLHTFRQSPAGNGRAAHHSTAGLAHNIFQLQLGVSYRHYLKQLRQHRRIRPRAAQLRLSSDAVDAGRFARSATLAAFFNNTELLQRGKLGPNCRARYSNCMRDLIDRTRLTSKKVNNAI
jgi:hypothetical protein